MMTHELRNYVNRQRFTLTLFFKGPPSPWKPCLLCEPCNQIRKWNVNKPSRAYEFCLCHLTLYSHSPGEGQTTWNVIGSAALEWPTATGPCSFQLFALLLRSDGKKCRKTKQNANIRPGPGTTSGESGYPGKHTEKILSFVGRTFLS